MIDSYRITAGIRYCISSCDNYWTGTIGKVVALNEPVTTGACVSSTLIV
ncbi:MAG: hypothetical protein IPN67_20505 [Bacteroidales bacterium]|nr:hypothetical protein [Bacteroidales bacterium]